MAVLLSLIAAVSADGFISRSTGVPWDLPEDRAQFRAYTRDKWLLLGRRTYGEMLGWFRPGHHPLVLSREPDWRPAWGARVASVPEALALAEQAGCPELVVCGGGQAYALALPWVRRLILTRVDESLGAGVAFPEIDWTQWREVDRHVHPPDAAHACGFTVLTCERLQGGDG